MESYRIGYLQWKKSKSFNNQSFQKLPKTFSSERVGIGVGIGVGDGKALKTSTLPKGEPSAQCESLYRLYPRHVGKKAALKAIVKALQKKPFDELLLAVQAFCRKCSAEGTEEQFIPHPATWFNAGRYEDEEFTPGYAVKTNGGRLGKGDSNIAAAKQALRGIGSGPDTDGDVPFDDGRGFNFGAFLEAPHEREP
jgi:hypothetical protein